MPDMTSEQRDEAEKIAKGLSEAQRRMLTNEIDERFVFRRNPRTLRFLQGLFLYDQAEYPRLTPLGKRVAAVTGE